MELLDLRKVDISLDALATYLANFETERSYDKLAWERRLRFWWDLNPYFDVAHPRGWVLSEGSKIRGFMGAIVGRYHATKDGQLAQLSSLSATTWRVDADARSQSMQIFMKYLQAKKEFLLVDTTPTPAVEKILEAFKFQGPYVSRNTLYPLIPSITKRIFKDKAQKISRAELAQLKVDFAPPEGCFERKITKEFLDWYCFESPKQKHLYGLVESGRLHAYMVVLNETFRRIPIARVVDFDFSKEADGEEILKTIVNDTTLGARLLVLTTFPDNPKHKDLGLPPWTITKQNQPHYLFANAQTSLGLKWAPKMLDGDYGC